MLKLIISKINGLNENRYSLVKTAVHWPAEFKNGNLWTECLNTATGI